ncbi:MAG: MFS transporter, partial [Oscillospiraceae bacterium]
VLLFSPTIIQLGQDRGLTENVAVLSIAIGSVASAFGRVLCPVISDKIGRKNMDIILLTSLGLLSIAFIFAQNIFVIVVYCMLTFCYSGEAAVIPSLATDLYGFSHSGVNYGLLALGMSVGSVGFPLLVTAFGGANEVRHIFAIAAAFLGVVVLLFLKPIQGEKL